MALKGRRTESTDRELDAALARGKKELAQYGARKVRYDAAADRIEITLNDSATVSIARKAVPGLEDASANDLAGVRLTPMGTSLSFERLDADYAVHGLIRKVLGLNAQQRAAGSATSPAKRSAAVANGALGGRPRKPASAPSQPTRGAAEVYGSVGVKGHGGTKYGASFYDAIGMKGKRGHVGGKLTESATTRSERDALTGDANGETTSAKEPSPVKRRAGR